MRMTHDSVAHRIQAANYSGFKRTFVCDCLVPAVMKLYYEICEMDDRRIAFSRQVDSQG